MDIGELTGTVLVFGGPYGNLAATRAMRDTADSLGIAADHVICTGDTVAYCAEPVETLAIIRDWGCRVVMGNCEESLANGASNCACGFDSGSRCAELSSEWFRFNDEALSPEHRSWMGSLPRQIRFRLGGHRFLVVHGSTDIINEFVFASSPAVDKARRLDQLAVDAVIGGHCGLPFGQHLDTGDWLNAGAIGMPANDGTRDGWYMLLTNENAGVRTRWHRLSYDYSAAAASMRHAGVSLPYAACLETGLWPSLDVLPDTERQQTGKRIRLSAMILGRST